MAERTEKHGFAKQAYDKVCYEVLHPFFLIYSASVLKRTLSSLR
jgi:hypothetical protein